MNRLTYPLPKRKAPVTKKEAKPAASRLVLYGRVSTYQQEDNNSIPMQLDRLRSYCDSKQFTIVGEFSDVASGGKQDREEFQKALELVFSDKADGIACYYMDRFARNTKDFLELVERFNAAGKIMVFLDINLDTSTAVGQFGATVLMAAFEMLRKQASERTKATFQHFRDKGMHDKGRPPYGWKVSLDETGKSLHILEPDEAEQDVIEVMQEMHAGGMSFSAIARDLNAQGIPTRENGTWAHVQVGRILRQYEELEEIQIVNEKAV